MQTVGVTGKALFSGLLMALFTVSLHGEIREGLLWSTFAGEYPVDEGPHNLIFFQKVSLPTTITLGFRLSTSEFQGHTNIQTTTYWNLNYACTSSSAHTHIQKSKNFSVNYEIG